MIPFNSSGMTDDLDKIITAFDAMLDADDFGTTDDIDGDYYDADNDWPGLT